LRVEGWGLRVEGWGLRVEGWGLRIEGWGLRVEGWGLRVEGWESKGLVRAIALINFGPNGQINRLFFNSNHITSPSFPGINVAPHPCSHVTILTMHRFASWSVTHVLLHISLPSSP
jgi:hypothetical protein